MAAGTALQNKSLASKSLSEMGLETWEKRYPKTDDPVLCNAIARKKAAGKTNQTIARESAVSVCTVRKVLKKPEVRAEIERCMVLMVEAMPEAAANVKLAVGKFKDNYEKLEPKDAAKISAQMTIKTLEAGGIITSPTEAPVLKSLSVNIGLIAPEIQAFMAGFKAQLSDAIPVDAQEVESEE